MKRRRYLVLHLPRLATDRIRQREPGLTGLPLATWDTVGNRRVLASVDAPGTTLQSGQALADAQAMYPALVLRAAEPEADRAFLDRLALWAVRYTPLAAADAPDGLVLDVTGCTGLFGGEAALLGQVGACLDRGGIAACMVMAGIVDAGAALARAGHHGKIVPPDEEHGAVATLPLGMLRLSPDCLAGLNRLGLQRITDILRQPRAPLTRRFGRPLMDVLDALTGERPRALPPIRPPPVFMDAVNFLEPLVTRPGIDRALDVLLEALCQRLAEAGQGARAVTLRAFRVDRDVQEIAIGTGLPTRVPAHLRRLFANELERLEPALGFERMTLEAGVTNRLDAAQSIMGVAGIHEAMRAEALGQLLDRLSQRLPVWRWAPGDSHWPERSVIRVGPFDPVAPDPQRSPLPAPVRLLKQPQPVVVVALACDGSPAQMRLDGTIHHVATADGPERIEREWWHDAADRAGRDYYRVELQSGLRLWIGRVSAPRPNRPDRWFLHGYLA